MNKILPSFNVVDVTKNSIISKLIPIHIIYAPTSFKPVKPTVIATIIGLIESILKTISFLNILKYVTSILSNISKVLANISKPIYKTFKAIIKTLFVPIKKIIKLVVKSITGIFSITFKLITKTFKKILKNIMLFIGKLANFAKNIGFRIVSFISRIVKKSFTSLKNIIFKNQKLIKLFSKATKFLGFRKTSKTLKMTGGKIMHFSGNIIKKMFQKFIKIGKNTITNLSSVSTKAKKGSGIKQLFKSIITPVLGACKQMITWFADLGKRMFNKHFAKKIMNFLAPVLLKLTSKLGLTISGSAALISGIGAWAGMLLFLSKWVAGYMLDIAIAGKNTWRNILTAILENMPYLDMVFVISHLIEDLSSVSGPFGTAFKWLQSALNIKDNELDTTNDRLKSNTNIKKSNNTNPNIIALNNINQQTTNQPVSISQYNLINVLDDFYNNDNKGLINLINQKFENVYNIFEKRNNQIMLIA